MPDPGSTENLFPQVSALDLAFILFKRKWSIILILVTALLASFVWLWLIRDDLYTVSAKVLVKFGREEASPPTVLDASPTVIGYRSEDVNSEIAIFESSELLGRVVDELHLDQPVPQPVPQKFFLRLKYEVKLAVRQVQDVEQNILISVGLRERLSPREKAIAGLQKGLSVTADKDSNVLVAELELPYRHGASAVLNRLLGDYLDFRQQVYQSGDLNFFRSQVDKAGAQLQDAEDQLQKFEDDSNITQLDKQETVLLDNVAAARDAWKEIDVERQEFASRVVRIDQEMKKPDPDFSGIEEYGHEGFEQTIAEQLAALQQERDKLRLTELDSGDHIQNNRRQFATLAAMLSANFHTALAEKEEQTELRKSAYERLQADLANLHSKQTQWVALQRKTQDLEGNYLLYRKKLEEASADDAMEKDQLGNVAVVEQAMDPLAPSGMGKATLLAICLLSAVLVALTWVVVAEYFDHRVYTVDDLERHLSGPVLATVAEANSEREVVRAPKTSPLSVYGGD